MNNFKILLVGLALAVFQSAQAGGGHDHGHGHGPEEHTEEPAKGPHGGRLLEHENFALEVKIFEDGVPPEYRLFAFEDGKPVSPSNVNVTIKLTRFGGRVDEFQFAPKEGYLSSPKEVEEPHSFEVAVSAEYEGRPHSWTYASHEGRTELSEEALRAAELTIDTAVSRRIENSQQVFGRILLNENRVAHISPRFSGVVRDIKKSLGDPVQRGEVLAVIENNQNLQPYELRSQIAGVVIKRHATLGEAVSESEEIFVVADLSELWADFHLYSDDADPITVGQSLTIDLGAGKRVPAKVTYISPITNEATQSKLIRAVLPNPNGTLRPGLFVSGTLTASETEVAVAVKREAIQTFREWNVVYLTDGHVFQAMPVELGRKDKEYVEVLSGIEAGNRYVSRNSFIIKADIEKAGASHDH